MFVYASRRSLLTPTTKFSIVLLFSRFRSFSFWSTTLFALVLIICYLLVIGGRINRDFFLTTILSLLIRILLRGDCNLVGRGLKFDNFGVIEPTRIRVILAS